MLRGIRAEFGSFYEGLLTSAAVQPMLGQEIVDTEIVLASLPGYALTLRHRRLATVSYCYEWPVPMLKDAALLTLDICARLAEHDLTLQDANPWNVVFEGTTPIFVDFTSIVPVDPHLLWVPYEQFCRFFLNPLLLHASGLGRTVRALLRDQVGGVGADDVAALLPWRALIRRPWIATRVHLPRLVLKGIRRAGREESLAGVAARLTPDVAARRAFFRALRRQVATIPAEPRRSGWTEYHGDLARFELPDGFTPKQATVAAVLDRCRPETVTDIGCNTGGFSVLAARAGARVVAMDADADSAALVYAAAKARALPILPLVMDVAVPSPACGWRGEEFAPAAARLRSQMAFALALVHHLAITNARRSSASCRCSRTTRSDGC